jgi:hypothetical protein
MQGYQGVVICSICDSCIALGLWGLTGIVSGEEKAGFRVVENVERKNDSANVDAEKVGAGSEKARSWLWPGKGRDATPHSDNYIGIVVRSSTSAPCNGGVLIRAECEAGLLSSATTHQNPCLGIGGLWTSIAGRLVATGRYGHGVIVNYKLKGFCGCDILHIYASIHPKVYICKYLEHAVQARTCNSYWPCRLVCHHIKVVEAEIRLIAWFRTPCVGISKPNHKWS